VEDRIGATARGAPEGVPPTESAAARQDCGGRLKTFARIYADFSGCPAFRTKFS
jgi:hypothetical protein